MKKIINNPEDFVREVLEGVVMAYPAQIKLLENSNVLVANHERPKNKVGIVTAGGSGHLPVFMGYVGRGMLDGCAVGEVFASPSAAKMADMIKACDLGGGVLCLFGNYGGDKMNFEMACEMTEFDGVKTKMAVVHDDIASSGPDSREKRRGVAGMVFAFKTAGAAAQKLMDLEKVHSIALKTIENTRTMGVALTPCIVPAVGKPTFKIADDEIEIGMGIHGEPGVEVRKMMTADEIALMIVDYITKDMPLAQGDEISVLVNGLGATPLEELYIVYRKVHRILADMGVGIYMPHIGEYATSMEMAGLSVSVLKLDDELKELLSYPADTPFYTNHNLK